MKTKIRRIAGLGIFFLLLVGVVDGGENGRYSLKGWENVRWEDPWQKQKRVLKEHSEMLARLHPGWAKNVVRPRMIARDTPVRTAGMIATIFWGANMNTVKVVTDNFVTQQGEGMRSGTTTLSYATGRSTAVVHSSDPGVAVHEGLHGYTIKVTNDAIPVCLEEGFTEACAWCLFPLALSDEREHIIELAGLADSPQKLANAFYRTVEIGRGGINHKEYMFCAFVAMQVLSQCVRTEPSDDRKQEWTRKAEFEQVARTFLESRNAREFNDALMICVGTNGKSVDEFWEIAYTNLQAWSRQLQRHSKS